MKMRNLLTATATMAVTLAPAIGSAQDDGFLLDEAPAVEPQPIFANEVEAGIGYNSEDSFKFGEYTGLEESGPFVILNFDLLNRGAWDGEDTTYYRIRGERLGLDSRRFEAEYGEQGRYAAGVGFRQIPHFLIDNARTPYRGTGGAVLTLPANWEAAPSTQQFASLGESLRNIDIENDRQEVSGFLSLLPGDGWTLDVKVSHETRDGTKPAFAAFGTNGGNPSAVGVARPIDYGTSEINATLGRAEKKYQFELGYRGSFFKNDNPVLNFQNPFSQQFSGSPWASAAGFPASGGYSLAPDNEAHQFLFSGGYTLDEASRISGQLSYSMLKQDDRFLPYSTNPGLVVRRGLPRQSLDGDLGILVADLAYSTRLQPRTHLRAHARYEDQDNSTPQDVFVRIAGDAENQAAGFANDSARINLPYSFEKIQFDVELGHRLTTRTSLGLEYEFEEHSRTFSEVEETTEHALTGKVRHRFSNTVNGRFSYTRGDREGNDPYRDNAPFLLGHTPEFLGTLAPANRFENHPEIRKFNLADRTRDELKGTLHIAATPDTNWSLNGFWLNEDFDDSSLGLTERQMLRGALDVNHALRETVLLRAYYSYEQFDNEVDGHAFRPGVSLTDPALRWTQDSRDRVHTLGVGLSWAAIPNKLDIDFDYNFSLAETDIDFEAGSTQPPEAAPTLNTDRHTVQVTADWRLKEDRRLRFGYTFEYFDADDFALDGIGVNSMPRVLTFGNEAPDYTAHVFGVSYVANW
jgi:MtrB/PioB family decaheme-associated outer membrane protein